MNFKEKLETLKLSEVLRAITASARNPYYVLDQNSYGTIKTGLEGSATIYACYATNAITKLSGIVFTKSSIRLSGRSEALGIDQDLLIRFQWAIDALRRGIAHEFLIETEKLCNTYHVCSGLLVTEYYYKHLQALPKLGDPCDLRDLVKYDELATLLELAGH